MGMIIGVGLFRIQSANDALAGRGPIQVTGAVNALHDRTWFRGKSDAALLVVVGRVT